LHEDQSVVAGEGDRPTIRPQQALEGGKEAIELMKAWWVDLFAAMNEKNKVLAMAV